MKYLTQQEEEAMLIIWRLGRGFVKDILEQYPEPRPPYTTLASTVKNLERKAYVDSRRYGNTYEYTPVVVPVVAPLRALLTNEYCLSIVVCELLFEKKYLISSIPSLIVSKIVSFSGFFSISGIDKRLQTSSTRKFNGLRKRVKRYLTVLN